MKTVRVSSAKIQYPTKCACCLDAATTSLEVSKEDLKRLALAVAAGAAISSDGGPTSLARRLRSRRALQVPYCSVCSKHVRWARMKGWVGVGLSMVVNAFFAALGGVLLHTFLSFAAEDEKSAPSLAVVVGLCVLTGVAIALAQVRLKPAALDRRHVPGGRDAVEISSFNGETMVLRVHNDMFAAELLRANPGAA